jgi:mono/diheme cytochrome c family protein
MLPRPTHLWYLGLSAAGALALAITSPAGAQPEASTGPTGRQLFEANCAACHGVDGRGNPQPQVGFDVPLPDFTDCDFTSREPKADWVGVASEGGPLRGFDTIMPAFGDALSDEELELLLGHVYGLCEEPERYPRGEFNLPRPMWTAKAYIEDEAILTVDSPVDGALDLTTALTYEQRFGTRNNWEIKIPWTTLDNGQDTVTGIGDVALAAKRLLVMNADAGTIVAVVGEVILPVGNPERGLGKGYTVAEPFLAWGQILPAGFFLHTQAGAEIPLVSGHDNELLYRAALGRTFTVGKYGRAFSPMVGVHGVSELGDDMTPAWAVAPQLHVTLNQRQHVMLVAGAKVPVSNFDPAGVEGRITLLWDWFDGGFFEGW